MAVGNFNAGNPQRTTRIAVDSNGNSVGGGDFMLGQAPAKKTEPAFGSYEERMSKIPKYLQWAMALNPATGGKDLVAGGVGAFTGYLDTGKYWWE